MLGCAVWILIRSLLELPPPKATRNFEVGSDLWVLAHLTELAIAGILVAVTAVGLPCLGPDKAFFAGLFSTVAMERLADIGTGMKRRAEE